MPRSAAPWEIEHELRELKTNGRKLIAQKIAEALFQGVKKFVESRGQQVAQL
jgi:hypothetical protein